ncbi:MAG TPA: ATP-binding protein [Candidatus Saccharimonadales bacterium]|nr:ATP-binding protein [Candidatus Saccharimonadales bacterium]
MTKRVDNQAHNTVTLDKKGVIVSVLRGKQTGASIRAVAEESARIAQDVQAKGHKVLVLSDIRGLRLTDVTGDARRESKQQMSAGTDGTALVGRRGIMGLVLYLQQNSGRRNIRFFTNEHSARSWLEGNRTPGASKSSASLGAGIIMVLIGLSVLVGWYGGNAYLMRWFPSLRPMNPMAAVGLLAAGFGFCCYWFGKLLPLKIAGVFGALLGVAALSPLHVDHLLYGSKLAAAGAHTDLADSAALCFIALGLSPFTIEIKQAWFRRPLQYLIALTLLGMGLFNVVGQLYARDFIYGISGSFVMAINLAAAFVVAGVAMALLVAYRKIGTSPLGALNRMAWLLVAALLFVQVATYGAWAQALGRNRSDSSQAFLGHAEDVQTSLGQRVTAYLDALYGFKGLFAASDYVDQGEFESYYQSLNLNANYPGLRALSFISKVSDGQLPAFAALHKADKSLHAAGNPTFAITGKTALPEHYIVTYVANSATVGGNDLGAQPSRLQAFQRAEASGNPVSSGTLQFAASATTPAQNGFFLTIPVGAKGAPQTPIGFVNAVFSYDDFFTKAFMQRDLLRGINIRITDETDSSVIYKQDSRAASGKKLMTDIVTIPVVGHQWRLLFAAPANYGISAGQAQLPAVILVGGQAFAALLLLIFFILLRSRRQGYALAETITLDLRHERNAAVANDRKHGAILTSIGDAVFAIDTQGRIELFNPAAQRISGFSEEEALGKPYEDVLRFEFEKDGRVNRSFIASALNGKLSSMANHTVLIRKDGQRIAVADSAAPIRSASGGVAGAIVVFRDVSKDYELDKAKTEFVSLASHQLRTPLSAINWYSEMLINGDAGKLSKRQHEYILEIFQGNQRMVELVNSLLDVSRLEVGKLPSAPQYVDLPKLVDDLERELTVSIREHDLKFKKEISDLQPVFADPKQLRMILQNLLSNAVKYTPDRGSVTARLHKARADEIKAAHLAAGHDYWFFSVSDTGYGIPKAQQPKIFGKLFRADNVRVLDVEGTGLGLYIVKEIVERMGGRVWFESIESNGTTFYVVAPFPEHRPVK